MKNYTAMALALAAFTHTPAIAQRELSDRTFTDVETGTFRYDSAELSRRITQDAGLLEYTLSFSSPVTVYELGSYFIFSFDYRSDNDYYGNDFPEYTGQFLSEWEGPLVGVTDASFSATSLTGVTGRYFGYPPSGYGGGEGLITYGYYSGTLFGRFGDTQGVTYTLTTNFTPFVPEPSTWALLILGFGAIGAAMRKSVASKTGNRRIAV